ncbi:hypothetical protein MKW94_006124 [Papaver nudicaule]|uniref:Pre-rRNA-processing protein TSR2 n=1 Tax=Papaver nudicaule TaxID=74823 RepID=A0AA41VRQ8_PAPNU|nr:hypothetical protein [Papaver nudicaule]
MNSNYGSHYLASSHQRLRPESTSVFIEGINLILSRWIGLQLAIKNEWGGRDSRQKSEQFVSDILSWFSLSKLPLYVDDLEHMLDEKMLLCFHTEIDDGSIEEVAEELIIIYEDCLQGSHELVEKLRKSNSGAEFVSQHKQITGGHRGITRP